MEKHLVLNRFITPDGTVLVSRHTHDYVSHIDKNGDTYFTDGGTSYIRKSVNAVPMVDACVYSDAPFTEIREHITRGTFDKNGNRIWIPISRMSNKHLENCIVYNKAADVCWDEISYATYTYLKELSYRYEHSIFVGEYDYGATDCKCESVEFESDGSITEDSVSAYSDDEIMTTLYDALENSDKDETYSTSVEHMHVIDEIVKRYENRL